MDRRDTLLALLAVGAAPIVARAQQPGMRQRIVFFASDGGQATGCVADSPSFNAFLNGLLELGYTQGQNVDIECCSAESKYDRLDAIATEIVRSKPDVIVALAAPASLAAKRATSAIPIVSTYAADPVGMGLVKSLARPGGNVTGVSALASDYVAKSLSLLKEAVPRISRVGILGHRPNPSYEIYRRELEPAGRVLGVSLEFAAVEALDDVGAALQTLLRQGADSLLIMHQPFTYSHRQEIVNLVGRHRLPTMYGSREAVEMGGFMSYAVSVYDVVRRAAFFVDKIFKGATPSELPVEQPTRFDLAINSRTAKVLGIKFPPSVLIQASKVIE